MLQILQYSHGHLDCCKICGRVSCSAADSSKGPLLKTCRLQTSCYPCMAAVMRLLQHTNQVTCQVLKHTHHSLELQEGLLPCHHHAALSEYRAVCWHCTAMCASDSTSAEFACVATLLLQIAGAGVWLPRIERRLVLMTSLTMISTPEELKQVLSHL